MIYTAPSGCHEALLDGLRCLPTQARIDVERYRRARDARDSAVTALNEAITSRSLKMTRRAARELDDATEEYHAAALSCACDLTGAVKAIEDAERALAGRVEREPAIDWTPGTTRAA